jgi:hypothetical protein
MGQTGNVEKGGRNEHFNYSFQRKEDVFKAVQHALVEQGIGFTYEVEEVTISPAGKQMHALVKVRGKFHGGMVYESVGYGEGLDNGDKAVNKAVGQAIKYLLINTLLIPAEGDDSDAHSPEREAVPVPAPGTTGSDDHKEAYDYLTELTASFDQEGLDSLKAAKEALGVKSLKNASVAELRQLIKIAEKIGEPKATAFDYTEDEQAPF